MNEKYNEINYLWEYEYRYDANGLLQEIAESEDGKYAGKTSYLRDGGGRVKRVIDYDGADSFIMMFEHKYDAAGRCVEEKKYSAKHIVGRYNYQYDRSGNVAEKVPVPAWEFKERHHHGDFLYDEFKRY